MNTPFLRAIQHLRQYEELVLYGSNNTPSAEEEHEVTAFLAQEYEQEVLAYPHTAPVFHATAALWGARTLYTIAQFLLYRNHDSAEMHNAFPVFAAPMDAAAHLSADLCLRFLPDVLQHIQGLDPEDELIANAERIVQQWHFSGVAHSLPSADMDFESITANTCLHQLYINRVIERKALVLAQHPALKSGVQASLGLFASTLWSDFTNPTL